jgi:hypothetical protein
MTYDVVARLRAYSRRWLVGANAERRDDWLTAFVRRSRVRERQEARAR